MKSQLSRRDFLKLAGLFPLGIAAPRVLRRLGQPPVQGGKPQNVLIIVFDAWSAYHLSMHGYARETAPNITRLAQRAIRYHNHYAGGNFTSPGTASLLTGVQSWTHRAFNLAGSVDERFETRSIFRAFPNHHRMTYTHNGWAQIVTKQFEQDVDEFIPREDLLLASLDNFIPRLFPKDEDLAGVSWTRAMKVKEEGSAYSLLLSHLNEEIQEKRLEAIAALFPRGIPTSGSDSGFTLEQAHDYLTDRLASVSRPVFGYFHFLPPHFPYRTSIEFDNAFLGDGYQAVEKPVDLFAKSERQNLELKRRIYDEFILYCDREFARFYEFMEQSGMLEDTWLVLTSDHGEMFERGINGHSTDVLYQPIIRVPLMIFEPGRTTGMDVYDNTSAIDLLPTLTHVTGQKSPDWTEGVILPPFNPAGQMPDRNIYVVRATKSEKYKPLNVATFAVIREEYKLIRYIGYPQTPDGLTKLYDIRSDPDELNDLASAKRETTAELLNELNLKLREVNEPYL